MGEEQPMARPTRGSAALGATSSRSVLSSIGDLSPTTLSSAAGQVRTASQDTPARRGGRQVALVGVGVLALCALVAGVAVKLWGRSAAPGSDGQPAEKGAAVQPLPPPTAPPPVPVPPPAEPRVPHRPSSPSPSPIRRWPAARAASLRQRTPPRPSASARRRSRADGQSATIPSRWIPIVPRRLPRSSRPGPWSLHPGPRRRQLLLLPQQARRSSGARSSSRVGSPPALRDGQPTLPAPRASRAPSPATDHSHFNSRVRSPPDPAGD